MKKLLIAMLSILTLATVAIPTATLASTYCSPNARKQCISNIVYWYDSCGAVQSIAQNCNTTNQICQNAQCVNRPVVNPNPNPPQNTGNNHHSTACYNNNLYWYNQQGIRQDLNKTCADNNSCTTDSCGVNQCINTLKCDGSTCATNSADYMVHCSNQQNSGGSQTGGSTGTGTLGGSTGQQQNNQGGQTQTTSPALAISILAAKESTPTEWVKFVDAVNGDKLNFLLTVKNTSATEAQNITITVDVTGNIAYTGNLKIDNVLAAGSITTGVGIVSIPANTSKAITFSGTVQSATTQSIAVNAKASLGAQTDSDIVTVSATAIAGQTGNTATAAVSENGFVTFVKKWYIWGIIIIVLIALFIIIFRRLSSAT